MRLVVAAVGRLKRGPERELAERFRERAGKTGRAIGVRGVTIVETDEGRARSAGGRMAEEAVALARIFPENAAIVVLDAGGKALSSVELAGTIGRWRDHGRQAVVFVVGGADGVAPELARQADLVLSFGAATWPHQLVRVMLLEQLYRCLTILSGHPYHRK